MKNRLAKLIDVKSIMTLVFTVVFAVLASMGKISSAEFLDVFKLIVIFYFGTQSAKVSTVTAESVEAPAESMNPIGFSRDEGAKE